MTFALDVQLASPKGAMITTSSEDNAKCGGEIVKAAHIMPANGLTIYTPAESVSVNIQMKTGCIGPTVQDVNSRKAHTINSTFKVTKPLANVDGQLQSSLDLGPKEPLV